MKIKNNKIMKYNNLILFLIKNNYSKLNFIIKVKIKIKFICQNKDKLC